MRILAVCGMGLGSSLLLRMHVEAALKELGVEGTVEVSDVTSAASLPADLIVTSAQLAGVLGRRDVPVVTVRNHLDRAEVLRKLAEAIRKEG